MENQATTATIERTIADPMPSVAERKTDNIRDRLPAIEYDARSKIAWEKAKTERTVINLRAPWIRRVLTDADMKATDRDRAIGSMTLEEVDTALVECEEVLKTCHVALMVQATNVRWESGLDFSSWSQEQIAGYTFYGRLHPMLRDRRDAVLAWTHLVTARRRNMKLVRRRLTLIFALGNPNRSKLIEMIKAFQVVS